MVPRPVNLALACSILRMMRWQRYQRTKNIFFANFAGLTCSEIIKMTTAYNSSSANN